MFRYIPTQQQYIYIYIYTFILTIAPITLCFFFNTSVRNNQKSCIYYIDHPTSQIHNDLIYKRVHDCFSLCSVSFCFFFTQTRIIILSYPWKNRPFLYHRSIFFSIETMKREHTLWDLIYMYISTHRIFPQHIHKHKCITFKMCSNNQHNQFA